MKVLGICGHSGSGKTTLIEKLLPLLRQRGLRVHVIKHSHHDVVLEPPQKDSSRFRAAGAGDVMLVTPYRYAIMHELRDTPEPSLSECLHRLSPADLVLVEGFKREPIPRLEVYRPANGKPALYPQDSGILAVASDVTAPEAAPHWLMLNDTDRIVNWIFDKIYANH